MEKELFTLNNNIFNDNTVKDTRVNVSIAEYLEDVLYNAIKEYEVENSIIITDADIMCKNGQIFVGPNSVKFNKK